MIDFAIRSNDTGVHLVAIILSLGLSCVWGIITKSINENKGHDGGFAWGFWLGLIGLAVVLCRPAAECSSAPPVYGPDVYRQRPPEGWVCDCGRFHKAFESSCVCGKTKYTIRSGRKAVSAPQSDSEDDVTLLRKYKELADEGVITQEEFEAKKKKILGL